MRSIDELIKLDSYQDMTDEEIESLINYKQTLAIKNTMNSQVATIAANKAESSRISAIETAEMARLTYNELIEQCNIKYRFDTPE